MLAWANGAVQVLAGTANVTGIALAPSYVTFSAMNLPTCGVPGSIDAFQR